MLIEYSIEGLEPEEQGSPALVWRPRWRCKNAMAWRIAPVHGRDERIYDSETLASEAANRLDEIGRQAATQKYVVRTKHGGVLVAKCDSPEMAYRNYRNQALQGVECYIMEEPYGKEVEVRIIEHQTILNIPSRMKELCFT